VIVNLGERVFRPALGRHGARSCGRASRESATDVEATSDGPERGEEIGLRWAVSVPRGGVGVVKKPLSFRAAETPLNITWTETCQSSREIAENGSEPATLNLANPRAKGRTQKGRRSGGNRRVQEGEVLRGLARGPGKIRGQQGRDLGRREDAGRVEETAGQGEETVRDPEGLQREPSLLHLDLAAFS